MIVVIGGLPGVGKVEGRTGDLPGHRVPDWADVQSRVVDDWTEPHVVVDTCTGDPSAAVLAGLTAGAQISRPRRRPG